jgi:hypothetical protein
MITVVRDVEQGSEEWLAARDGKYTGTSAIRLLKYGDIEYSRTQVSDFRGNFFTKRGHILEDQAIEIYQAVYGEVVDRPGYVLNDEFPRCLFSPDGLTDTRVIEVKCFNAEKHMAMRAGDIPVSIKAQIHFGMLISGLRAARLVIYNPDVDSALAFKAIDIPYQPAIESNFRRRLQGVLV